MTFTKIQNNLIKSRLSNTGAKLKSILYKEEDIPTAEQVFKWFQDMLPFNIKQNAPPKLFISYPDSDIQLEFFFFFDNERLYYYFEYEKGEYRGRMTFDAGWCHCFLDSLDPDDPMDEELMIYLAKKYNIEFKDDLDSE